MKDDLELIVIDLPKEQNVLHIYAIGDVHVGSAQFDEDAIKKKIQIIHDDPYAVVCLCGDLGDFGLKNSRTNIYQATLTPQEQVQYIRKLFDPIKDKIIALVPGNHEERITREVGTSVLYDLAVLWGCQDRYRENVAIIKVLFGLAAGKKQRNVFCGIVTHGSSRNKHKRFIASFDGIDWAISGHSHLPEYSPHGKIRVNSQASTATHVSYKELVVDAHLKPGGYGIKKEYEIPPPPELQYLELYTVRENNYNRTVHKIINYHSIQL